MAIILDGNNGVSYPDGTLMPSAPTNPSTNRILTNRMPPGAVVQVVQATTTSSPSTTSTSFVTTGLTASITPYSVNSKILAISRVSKSSLTLK